MESSADMTDDVDSLPSPTGFNVEHCDSEINYGGINTNVIDIMLSTIVYIATAIVYKEIDSIVLTVLFCILLYSNIIRTVF